MSEVSMSVHFREVPGSRSERTLFGEWTMTYGPIPFVAERRLATEEQESRHFEYQLAKALKAALIKRATNLVCGS
jgi:hypothetical protein